MMSSRDSVAKAPEKNRIDDSKAGDSETAIVIGPGSSPRLDSSTHCDRFENPKQSGKAIAAESAAVESRLGFPEEKSCVIDVKNGGEENSDCTEKICRICHLDYDIEDPEMDLKFKRDVIELGCGCKGELGFAHPRCAAAWFQHKGNRLCEICGKPARNIAGILADHRFMEQWSGDRQNNEGESPSETRPGCWQGQPFCNLLMACLVISFVFPWFLRVSIF